MPSLAWSFISSFILNSSQSATTIWSIFSEFRNHWQVVWHLVAIPCDSNDENTELTILRCALWNQLCTYLLCYNYLTNNLFKLCDLTDASYYSFPLKIQFLPRGWRPEPIQHFGRATCQGKRLGSTLYGIQNVYMDWQKCSSPENWAQQAAPGARPLSSEEDKEVLLLLRQCAASCIITPWSFCWSTRR